MGTSLTEFIRNTTLFGATLLEIIPRKKSPDAVVNLYRASGFTVQAILPPQKITDGVVRILVTEAKLHGMHSHWRQAVSDPEPL